MKFLYLFTSVAILFLSCASRKKQADIIVTNAKVYSVNDKFELAQSFAVKNGKFIAVGSNDEITNAFATDKVVDLEGKSVYPGFYDAHCHFYGYGLNLQKANLVGTKSFDEVMERIKQHAQYHPSEWILGRGWDQNDWELKEFPTNEKLNETFPDKPVVLTRIDGHALIANSEALKRAGVTIESKIEGGKFLKKDGKLTGVLIDNAEEMVMKAVPKPNIAIKTRALLEAQKACFAVGLTTVDDAGLSKETVLLIDELQKLDSLKMRVYAMLSPSIDNLQYFVKNGPYKTDFLNVRSIKLYADGALGSRGACLLKPYSDDPDNHGFLVSTPEQLKEVCKLAFENNYQINTHAIGDSANRLMLKMYGEFLKKENNKRWRIEHAQVVNKNDFSIFRQFSIVPSVQPTHATSDMYWADERLGEERVKYAYAYKTLLKQNGWLAAGSDFPVEHINPLYGFYAAVARKDLENYPEDGFQMENAISREQALKAMTIWAAKSNFEEKEKGSIEKGKFADFVVLEKDIMEVDVKEVPKIKVLETFTGGEKVY